MTSPFANLAIEAQLEADAVLLELIEDRPWTHVGSSADGFVDSVEDPKDVDLLVLAATDDHLESRLAGHGFELEGEATYRGAPSTFRSWRMGRVNVLVTSDYDFFLHFNLAHDLAVKLLLTEKSDRIALFQAVLYRREWREQR